MPVRITPRDKKSASTQEADTSLAMTDAILISQASYTALEVGSGLLYGSI